MNTKSKGEATQAVIIAELVKRDIPVSIPFGDNQRYDIIMEVDSTLYKVQCKSACIKNGCLSFKSSSSYAHRGGTRKDYRGEVDFFAVWCSELPKEVYLVGVEEATITETLLRIEPPKCRPPVKVRWEKDYTLDIQLDKLYH